jgi:GntR family transcriptional regulator
MRVNRASGIPLYVQIRETVRAELTHIKAGMSLSTEVELCSRFGVSLITVRKAIEDLVAEGLLVRKQGRGTFVVKPKLTHELNAITSWTEQLRALGYTPGTSHREVREVAPDPQIAQLLGLGAGTPLIMMKRMRLEDGEPVSLMSNYIAISSLARAPGSCFLATRPKRARWQSPWRCSG